MSGSKILDGLTINQPCSASWEEMRGNDAVRYCTHCELNVQDLAQLTRAKAIKLVLRSEGRLCLRIQRRPNGEIVRRSDYSRLHSISRRASRLSAGAFTALIGLSVGTQAQSTPSAGNFGPDVTSSRTAVQPISGGASFYLSGTISDETGAGIVGAKITLSNEQTRTVTELESDERGGYRVLLNDEGPYRITIDCPGFRLFVREHFVAGPVAEAALDVTLEVGTVGGAITITPYELPILNAAMNGDVDALKEILQTGADVNQTEEDGTTALQLAVAGEKTEMVRYLLRAGARVDQLDQAGGSALFSIDDETEPELLLELLRAGANVNLVNRDGDTPLTALADADCPELIKILIAVGANINIQNGDGNSALMIAAREGNTETVEALLAAGADLSLRNRDGETALMLADAGDHYDIVELLQEAGALPDKDRR